MRATVVLALVAVSAALRASGPALDAEGSAHYLRLREQARSQAGVDDPAALKKLLEESVKLYTEDGDLWLRLGRSRLAAKEYSPAIAAYTKSLELGAFTPKHAAGAHYDIACAYALANEKQRAFEHLDKAMALGFRDLQHLRQDTDLNSLHADRRWETLAATKDVTTMSRDEGWRYDLWLLDREVRRIHFAPYKFVDAKTQDETVKKLHREIPKMTDNQVRVAFMRMMRRFGDGHTMLRFTPDHGSVSVPLQLYVFADGVHVISAAPQHAAWVGAKVVEVCGQPVDQVIAKLDEVVAQDNKMGILARAPHFLIVPGLLHGLGLTEDKPELPITFEKDGKRTSVVLKVEGGQPEPDWPMARSKEGSPLFMKSMDKPYWFEHLPDIKAVYFQYNAVRPDLAESTAAFSQRLLDYVNQHDVERIIVDTRWNGGGNSFLNMPIVNALIAARKANSRGKLFVIAGRHTFSAAQNFVTDLERALSPIFVGEPTGSSPNFVGESIRFVLPYSKMSGTISDLYWQRSWPMDHRNWIAPELPAPALFQHYRENRDPAMEAIRAYIKG